MKIKLVCCFYEPINLEVLAVIMSIVGLNLLYAMAILSVGRNNYMEHLGSSHTETTNQIYCFSWSGKAVMDWASWMFS
jgi:hypothetical protein